MNYAHHGGGLGNGSVSIHIRHCWRMNCCCQGPAGSTRWTGFNPHSPLLANEFKGSGDEVKFDFVFQSTFAIAGE